MKNSYWFIEEKNDGTREKQPLTRKEFRKGIKMWKNANKDFSSGHTPMLTFTTQYVLGKKTTYTVTISRLENNIHIYYLVVFGDSISVNLRRIFDVLTFILTGKGRIADEMCEKKVLDYSGEGRDVNGN